MSRAVAPGGVNQINDFFAAVARASDDDFKEWLAEINAASAELDLKIGIVRTIDDAKQVKAEADAYAKQVKDVVDKDRSNIDAIIAAANQKSFDADKRMDKARDLQAQSERAITAYEQKSQELDRMFKERDSNLVAREAAITSAQAKINADRADLMSREQALQNKLNALNSIKV